VEGIEPIAPQIAIINAINDPVYRFVVACQSRRTGKTFIANSIAFLKAMEPGTKTLIVSPNFSLTKISWNTQIGILNKHKIEVESKNKTEKEIWLANGSMIKFGSTNSPDSLVGHSYDLVLFDEAALDSAGKDAFNVQLRPTLDKENSKAIFISTPRGLNYFHEFYMRGFSDEYPTWASIHSTWKDNPRVSLEDIEDARKGMSRAEFMQEYEAEFTIFEGQIYEAFDPDKHVKVLELPKYRDNIMGIDPGYKDATGALVVSYLYDLDVFYVHWDYQKAQKLTSEHGNTFKRIYDSLDVDMVFCDSAAAQFRQDLVVEYDVPSTKAKKSVLDGIAYCQSLIESDKVIVHPDCEDTIKMLLNYRWDENPSLFKPRPKHDEYSHLADAFRYALYSYRRYSED
jgi:phage terminase large subunit